MASQRHQHIKPGSQGSGDSQCGWGGEMTFTCVPEKTPGFCVAISKTVGRRCGVRVHI